MGVKGYAIHLSFPPGNAVLMRDKAQKRHNTEGGDTIADYIRADTTLPAYLPYPPFLRSEVPREDHQCSSRCAPKQRIRELQTVKRNIDQILRREEPRRRKEQSHER